MNYDCFTFFETVYKISFSKILRKSPNYFFNQKIIRQRLIRYYTLLFDIFLDKNENRRKNENVK